MFSFCAFIEYMSDFIKEYISLWSVAVHLQHITDTSDSLHEDIHRTGIIVPWAQQCDHTELPPTHWEKMCSVRDDSMVASSVTSDMNCKSDRQVE